MDRRRVSCEYRLSALSSSPNALEFAVFLKIGKTDAIARYHLNPKDMHGLSFIMGSSVVSLPCSAFPLILISSLFQVPSQNQGQVSAYAHA